MPIDRGVNRAFVALIISLKHTQIFISIISEYSSYTFLVWMLLHSRIYCIYFHMKTNVA